MLTSPFNMRRRLELADLRDWGVEPNDFANDPAPVIAAALVELNGTGVHLAPVAGEYRCETPITPGVNLSKTGIIARSHATVFSGGDANLSQVIRFNVACTDVTLRNFTVDGRYGAGRLAEGGTNIAVGGGAERVTLDNLRIGRVPYDGWNVSFTGGVNTRIINCDIDLGARDGLHMSDQKHLLIANNNIHMMRLMGGEVEYPQAGPHSDGDDMIALGNCEYVTIVGNVLASAEIAEGRNIWIIGEVGQACRHIVVAGNVLGDGWHAAVKIEAAAGGLVEDVVIGDNQIVHPGRFEEAYVTVTPPVLRVNEHGHGVLLESMGDGAIIRRVGIRDNQFWAPKRSCVALSTRHAGALIEDVDIDGNSGYTDQALAWVDESSKGIENHIGPVGGDTLGTIRRVRERGNKFHGFPAGGIRHDGTTARLLEDFTVEDNEGWEVGRSGANADAVRLDNVRHQRVNRNRGKDRRATKFTNRAVTLINPVGEVELRDNDGLQTAAHDAGGTPCAITLHPSGLAADLPTYLHIDRNLGWDPWGSWLPIPISGVWTAAAGHVYKDLLDPVIFLPRFPPGVVPVVELMLEGAPGIAAVALNVTATGFTPRLWAPDNAVPLTGTLSWRARPPR